MSAFNHNKPPLPEGFTPDENYVVVGKGKKFYLHPGNILLRNIVATLLPEYSRANTKAEKSEVITKVVEQVNLKGAFVKRGSKSEWVYAEERLCREKCSQTFRDSLHETYKSSKVAKKHKRQREIEGAMFEECPSLISMGVVSQEAKRRRLIDPPSPRLSSDLFDFDFSMKLEASPIRPVNTVNAIRRASMAAGNGGDLTSLLTNMLALPHLGEDGNPYEPTPIQDSPESTNNSRHDIAFPCVVENEADVCPFGDLPFFGIEDASDSIWFGQEESRFRTQNMTFAFAA